MIPSKIDRMRRRPQRVQAIVANQQGQAKPSAEPGDSVKTLGTRYFEVVRVEREPGLAAWYWDPAGGVVREDKITDVYTKAEQQVNGALVQVVLPDGLKALPDEAINASLEYDALNREAYPFNFLSAEAVAALGEFQPVPERDIRVGDSVRFVSNYTGKEVVDRVSHINPSGSFGGFDADGRGWSRSENDLSLVAREDPAFIAPPVIDKPDPETCDHVWSFDICRKCFGGNPDWKPADDATEQGEDTPSLSDLANELVTSLPPLAKAAVGLCKLLAGYEPAAPPVIKEPEPAPSVADEDDLCRCTGYDVDCNHLHPNDAPSIPAPECTGDFDCRTRPHTEGCYAGSGDAFTPPTDPAPRPWLPDLTEEETAALKAAREAVRVPEPEPATYRCNALDGFGSQCIADHRTGDDEHVVVDPLNADAPSIPESWDLITAGDGLTYRRLADTWMDLSETYEYSTAEILEMGPVRRCVPVTLPDLHRLETIPFAQPLEGGNVLIRSSVIAAGAQSPAAVRQIAAELLAAALAAEEGR